MQVLKVKYGEDTRRVTLQSILSFADLTSLLEKLFNINGFTVKYEDEDKDLITVSTDLELKEAFTVATKQPNGILRLFLFSGKNSNGETIKDGKQENSQTPPPRATNENNANNNPNPFNFIQQILQNLSQQATPSQAPDVEKLNEMFNNFGFNSSNHQSQQPQVNWQQMQGLFGQLLQNPMIRDMIPSLLSTFSQFGNQMQDPFNNMWNNFNSNDNSNVNSNDTSKEGESEDTTIHYGVLCDSCEQTISGIRYKCTVCADYDLCEDCKNKPHVHNPTHPFQTITKPIHHGNGSGRGCPYGRYYSPPNRWNNRNPRQDRNSNNPKHQHLARFVSDVNLPDGTSMGPNNSFVKIWKLRNEGSQAWPEGTRLEHVGGDKISPVDFIAVQNVNPGEEIDLAVDMISPSKPGRYVTYWRLSQPDGSRFGQRVWADILVLADKPVETNNSTSNSQPTSTQPATSMEVETPVVPPVVPSTPPVPSAPPVTPDYPPKVVQLLEMGFSDPDLIITYLKKNNDDIMRTVQDLLNHSK